MAKKNQHYLLKYDDNWADEFDVSGFRVYSQEEYDEFQSRLERAKYSGEVYFGTNEFVEYHSKKEYLRCIETTKITAEEAATIIKLIGNEYGVFLEPNQTDDEDDDDNDNDNDIF